MIRILLELWPALLPIALYLLWLARHRRRAARAGEARLRFRDGPWYWAVLASILVACVLLIILGLSADGVKGEYAPPHLEGGRIVPGEIRP